MAGAEPIDHVCIWVSECDEENICDDMEDNVRYNSDIDEQVEKRKKRPWTIMFAVNAYEGCFNLES